MAKTIGISDLMLMECPWMEHWIKTHRKNLHRDELTCHWRWHDTNDAHFDGSKLAESPQIHASFTLNHGKKAQNPAKTQNRRLADSD